MSIVYEIRNLEEAREFILFAEDEVILTTLPGSVKYYGMLVINFMLKTLCKEFPEKVVNVVVNVGDDHAALFTALKFGYKNIVYTGTSNEVKALLKKL